jgi:hypothetical protein
MSWSGNVTGFNSNPLDCTLLARADLLGGKAISFHLARQLIARKDQLNLCSREQSQIFLTSEKMGGP